MGLTEETKRNIGRDAGVPFDWIERLDSTPFTFYLKHKKDIGIEDNGGIKYILNNRKLIFDYSRIFCKFGDLVKNVLKGELSLTEDELENYVFRRGFTYRYYLKSNPYLVKYCSA